jgi:RimJ/RimL family protein N-acetyltransferase
VTFAGVGPSALGSRRSKFMNLPREIRTERLLLRRWTQSDRAPFAALNADPRVMEHFPSVLTGDESNAMVERIEAHFERHGFGLWVVEVPDQIPFIGFVGLAVPSFEAHFTPCVEVGWRLAAEFWGNGYATEAGRAAIAFGFGPAGLTEIVSMTVPENQRSRRVMERLGMTHDPMDDFDHPSQSDHRRHVLYRLRPIPLSPPSRQAL